MSLLTYSSAHSTPCAPHPLGQSSSDPHPQLVTLMAQVEATSFRRGAGGVLGMKLAQVTWTNAM